MGGQTKKQEAQRRRRLDLEKPIEPVRITTDDDTEEEEREVFLEIDGDEYTIPKVVPAWISMAFLNNTRKHSSDEAVAQAMADLLGEDAMEAMADCKAMTPADLRQIMKIVEQKMLSAQDALGNS